MLQSFANNIFVEHVTILTGNSNLNSINVDEKVVSDHKLTKIQTNIPMSKTSECMFYKTKSILETIKLTGVMI